MDFRILGPLEVLDEGRAVRLGGSKQRALLAVFLLHRGETLSTDRLIDELWGERPPATAAKTVQVHISRLRKALAGGEGNGSADLIATRQHGYVLQLDVDRLDAHRFERLIAQGRGELAAGRPERAASALEEALSLWRGPPLADLAYEPFAQREIARLDDLRVAAIEQLIEAKLALGAHAEALGQLETLIGEHPYRERLRAQLMLALYRSDRQADALQAYQDTRREFAEELGIEPGERLRELERAILAQDPGLHLPVADASGAAEPAEAMRADLPAGTVTFLFTDVEGSTNLLAELGRAYADELEEHHRILRSCVERHAGAEVGTQGDAFFVAFSSAREAVAAAAEAQQALAGRRFGVRMGIHTGEAWPTADDYAGLDVNRAARICAAAHGGQVLLSQATRDLVDVETRDLGLHRLKDIESPERIFQLGRDELPPLKTLQQTNLPLPATRFLGRGRELREVLALLSRDDVRLLTLTGAGGTGKTRLAIAAASSVVPHYEHGVWWVSLSSLRDPDLVLATVAQVVGANQDLSAHIRDRQILVLFDNFEQVVDAAPGVSALLAECPNLRCLVTSREALHVGGEHVYVVPPLAPIPRTRIRFSSPATRTWTPCSSGRHSRRRNPSSLSRRSSCQRRISRASCRCRLRGRWCTRRSSKSASCMAGRSRSPM
jgi:DNA-binding SARP family transcriptional activator